MVELSKIGDIPIRLHRDSPENADIKAVTVKKEPTGQWYTSFTIDVEESEKPAPETISPDECVGIDLGILNYLHDSNGLVVDRLDQSDERERLEREQRNLSRKQYESSNWEKQRQQVAKVHARMSNRKKDFEAQTRALLHYRVFSGVP